MSASWLEDEGVIDVREAAFRGELEMHDVRVDAALHIRVLERAAGGGLRALDGAVTTDREVHDELAAQAWHPVQHRLVTGLEDAFARLNDAIDLLSREAGEVAIRVGELDADLVGCRAAWRLGAVAAAWAVAA